MKNLKRCTALLLTLLMLLGLLAGCGQNDTTVFRVGLESLPTSFDPALASTNEEKIVVSHLFENLMKLQSDGKGGSTAVNGLARSYTRDVSADGQETYTFRLRSGLLWSDGTPLKASDFVFAWQRLVNPSTGSPNASVLDMVAGYPAARAGNPSALQVSAPDDHTFVVTLSCTCPYFVQSICTAAATMPVRSDVVEQENWSMSLSTLVTNGAYTASEWVDDSLTLLQTKGYYDSRRLGPDQLVFRFTTDAQTADLLFDRNEIDFVLGLTDEAVSKKIDSWTPDNYPMTSVVLLNQRAKIAGDENIRRAMSLVIDRNAITQLLGERTYHAAEGLVTWGIPNSGGTQFREIGSCIDNDPANYEKNVQTAKQLMRESGYTGEKLAELGVISMLYESGAITDSLAKLLQKTWQDELGLTVTLQGVPSSEIAQTLKKGEYTIAALRISSDRSDATGFLNRWRSGNEGNYANFSSSAYDMLLRVAAVSSTNEARDAYLEDAERLLLEIGNVIPLYYCTRSWELSDRYTGVFGDGIGRYFFYGVNKASK